MALARPPSSSAPELPARRFARLTEPLRLHRGGVIEQPVVAWDRSVLDALLAAALLGYLAIAHHGRGRGAWVAQDPPAAWTAAVAQVLAERAPDIAAVWQRRDALLAQPSASAPPDTDTLLPPLQALLDDLCARLLARLYPQADALDGA